MYKRESKLELFSNSDIRKINSQYSYFFHGIDNQYTEINRSTAKSKNGYKC